MTPKITPGRRITAAMDAALARAGESIGQTLEWDENESETIARAAGAADRRDQLQRLFDAELAGQKRPDHLAKLDNAIRQCDKLVVGFMARAMAGLKPAKNPVKQRAANHRWRAVRREQEENHGA